MQLVLQSLEGLWRPWTPGPGRRKEDRGERGCVTFEADSSIDFQCYQQRKERESSREIRVTFLPTLSAVRAFRQIHVIDRYDGSSHV